MKKFKQLRKSLQCESMDICPVCDHDPCICETGQHIEEATDMCNVCGQTPCNCTHIEESFKVGDKVRPNAGPHKGMIHDVIHVHNDGSVNIKPSGVPPTAIKYHLGAAKATPKQLERVNEETEQIDEVSYGTLQSYRSKAHTQIQHYKHASGQNKPEAETVLAKREKGMASATKKVIAVQDKQRTPIVPQKAAPYKPLGGYDPKSGKSYSESVEQDIEEAYPGHIQKGKELDAATKKIQANLDRRMRGHELDAATKEIQKNLDKRIKKIDKGVTEESELGDLAHPKTMKHRFLVTFSEPMHADVSKRKEKQKKQLIVPSTHNGETVYKADAEIAAKKHMKKQGYKVHSIEHVGMVERRVNESEE